MNQPSSPSPVAKYPPHSLEAEQSVIGGLMIDNGAWDKIADKITEHDFYLKDHAILFGAISELVNNQKPMDLVTISEYLDNHQQLDAVGGLNYLDELARNIPSAVNIDVYADIIRERSILRDLITAGTEITSDAFTPAGRTSTEILDQAERKVLQIGERNNKGRLIFRPLRDVLGAVMERIDELFAAKSPITGLPTGFRDLDNLTAGLQQSDLIIVAGRPSSGKTAFAMNISENVAIKEKSTVAIFSMEMPAEQLIMRMLASLARVNQHKIRTGQLSDVDWDRLTSALSILNEANIFIDDSPALTPAELRARCRRLKREHGLGLVVIDYLQLMQVPGNKENRAVEISEISRSLKALAKEANVPVLALSQLNRSLEQRQDKRPVMSDLRESGAIEQDADVIAFIYRDEMYNKETNNKGKAEVIIGKQRNGPIDTVSLAFLGQYTRFENYSYEDYGGYQPIDQNMSAE